MIGTTDTTSFIDELSQGGFTYAYKVRGADSCAEGPLSSCTSATSTAPCRLRPAFDATGVSATNNLETGVGDVELSWPEAESQCPLGPGVSYNIYRSTSPGFTPL